MRIDYEYGAPGMRESFPQAFTSGKNNYLTAYVEEDQLPLYHQVESIPTGMQPHVPFIWGTPTKSALPRVESYQAANTPVAIPSSVGYDSSDNSASPTPRYSCDQQYADEVRLSIDFQNLQHLSPQCPQLGTSKTEVVLHTFGPKFVLDVMGGAGAVWGFSEGIGLRTSLTLWFWRPVSMFAAALSPS